MRRRSIPLGEMTALSRAAEAHTGGMVALVPTQADALRLQVAGPWEPADVLHSTLYFLGEDLNPQQQQLVRDGMNRLVATWGFGPVVADLWATGHFNPTTEDACAVYLLGRSPALVTMKAWVDQALRDEERLTLPPQHEPWVPHLTIGYGLDPILLDRFGVVTFDRLRVAFGLENVVDFPLM